MNLFSRSLFTSFSVLSLVISVFFSLNVFADESTAINQTMWKDIGEQKASSRVISAKATTLRLTARSLELDELSFKTQLNELGTSNENNVAAKATTQTSQSIILPMPDGSQVQLQVSPNKVMSDALAMQFPDIKTWKVTNVAQGIQGVIDFTYKGFHGMLIMPDGDRVFIEPDAEYALSSNAELSAQGRYLSFSKKQNKDSFNTEFSCGVHDDGSSLNAAAKSTSISEGLSARPAPDLITYRLAVAATGEYTQVSGGSVALALSNITTTINRVNEIYARDLGIVFQLVDEQSDIIYLNPVTDPYTNSDVFKLIQENDQNLSSSGVLGKDKYDVGHVFGAGNVGGLAIVGGVCIDAEKAYGATGITSPFGDAFALDYVAHELGHQMGGTHTFNSACGDGSERSAITAVEPGSGSTIMAYPGICQENNLQNSVDAQFHVVSIDQISTVTREGDGSNCGISSVTGNENPTVNAGEDTNVPARTPLVLIATGDDTDNDALTYTWDQVDTGAVSDVNVDTGDNALFRSRPLSNDNVRFIPSLEDLFAGTTTLGELLPITNRDINMVATVRDGEGGVIADQVKLAVFDTGEAFSVTSPSNDITLRRLDRFDVRWNVAGSNTSPISCTNVDIGLVLVDGRGVDIVTTNNDGRAEITIPDDAPALNNARIIVSCSTSNFFSVSSGRVDLLAEDGGDLIVAENTDSSSGGGVFGIFMLLWGAMLVCFRKTHLDIR